MKTKNNGTLIEQKKNMIEIRDNKEWVIKHTFKFSSFSSGYYISADESSHHHVIKYTQIINSLGSLKK